VKENKMPPDPYGFWFQRLNRVISSQTDERSWLTDPDLYPIYITITEGVEGPDLLQGD